MWRVMLGKDLRRAWRNPLPYLIQLAVPLVITALLGMVFGGGGGGGDGGGLGKVRVAVVDEDGTPLLAMLRGGMNQGEAAERMEVMFLDRDAALLRVTDNEIAAVLVIPKGFTRGYLGGGDRPTLELVKNPAQSIHPAVVEELVRVLVTGLNVVARNLQPELVVWREIFLGEREVGMREVGERLAATGERLEAMWERLDPLPVRYERAEPLVVEGSGSPGERVGVGGQGSSGGWNVFSMVLPGLTAMFLLFLADVAMRDVHREHRWGTLSRAYTLPRVGRVWVASKVAFTLVTTGIGAWVLMGMGGWLFGIQWRQPWVVVALTGSMVVFAGGMMAALGGWVRGEKQADVLNTMVAMGLGLASGCAFPAQALPRFLREEITPWLPPFWFVDGVRRVQTGEGWTGWWGPVVALVGLGLVLIAVGTMGWRRGLARGGGR